MRVPAGGLPVERGRSRRGLLLLTLAWCLCCSSRGQQTTSRPSPECAQCLEACSSADLVAALAARVAQLEEQIARIEGGGGARAAPPRPGPSSTARAPEECSGPAESEAARTLARLSLRSLRVIGLARAIERAVHVQGQAAQQGLSVEVLTASDGRDPRFRSSVFASRHPDSTCADIVGAMFESHLRAWEAAASTPGHTAVFEDDVVLAPDFAVELARRFPGLPEDYDIAFLGTTTRNASAYEGSPFLLRPDVTKPEKAILGMFAYIVSQSGAARLLELHRNEQRHRSYTAVDLWIGQHLSRISVFIFDTPDSLAKQLRETPSPTILSNRAVGLVVHAGRTESHKADRNAPENDAELSLMRGKAAKMQELFEANRFQEGLDTSDAAFVSMRTHACWSAANMLQNTGLMFLRLLLSDHDALSAEKKLLQAREAFASALRYFGGNSTQVGSTREKEYHTWIINTLKARKKRGLPTISRPPAGAIVLADGSRLWPEELLLLEPPRG